MSLSQHESLTTKSGKADSISEIARLRQKLETLQQEFEELKSEKVDLEILLETNLEHSDFVTDELFEKIETTIRENAKRFRLIAETTPVPIIISRVTDSQIVYINKLAGSMVTLAAEKMLGRKGLDFYENPAEREQILQILDKQGYVSDYEVQVKRDDGSVIWVSVSIQPLTYNKEACLLSAFYDLTERHRAEAERTRLAAIQQELDLAQQIQERLLPPSQPHWADLDIICYMIAARNVGGDFYAYYPLTPPEQDITENESNRFALAVGDVSGKGMPAALLMSVSFAALQTVLHQALSPSDLLSYLDNTIERFTRTTYQNCALSYVEISHALSSASDGTCQMKVANAGCMEPLIRRADGTLEWVEITGLPLGSRVRSKSGYAETTCSLNTGDFVVLSSDGVVEALNPANEMFGFHRFEEALANGPTTSAEAMLAHLRGVINDFTSTTELQDDLTIIIIRI